MSAPISKSGAPASLKVGTPSSASASAAAGETQVFTEPSWAPLTHSIRPARGKDLGAATASVAGDSVPSSFPIHDLSKIPTTRRAATGFRLDGGGPRLMWMTARRIEEPKEGKGFELAFFAHAGAIGRLEHRLRERKAIASAMSYPTRELKPDCAADRQVHVSGKQSWAPTSAKSLLLEQAGKFTVELVADAPEALKGAVRIRLFGDDQTSSKTLQQLVGQLGLQDLFAPPKPADLERFKLYRVLWHFAPEKLEALTVQSPLALSEKVFDQALAAAEISDTDSIAKANDEADLQAPKLDEYLRLLRTYAAREPKRFLEWASNAVNGYLGLLPSPHVTSGNESLRANMTKNGIDFSQDAITQSLNEPLASTDARRLLDFGMLLARKAEAAKRLVRVEVDDLDPKRLETLVAEVGFPPGGERLKGLRFEEVYPGYFTVVDPSLPDRLAERGARYLYSTAETPERVFDMLTEGQKSSATRFSEGLLVQGKSSNADFNSGGAFSIFSRLVTESSIEKKVSFGDWGGSRPYKVVISRDVLGRLDWYGYNSDNFGRSTGLTSANHGEKLIETIQSQYGSGNELMFPVGNAPAYFDFVVCATDQQRDKLIAVLTERGMTSFNGRPLADFVRTEKTFFEHPRDQTLERAVAASVAKLNLVEPEKELEVALRAIAESKLEVWVKASAQTTLEKETPSLVPETAEKAARASADQAASKVKLEPKHLSSLGAFDAEAKAQSREAVATALAALASPEALALPSGPVEKLVRSKGKTVAENAAATEVQKLVKAALKTALAQLPSGLSSEAKKEKLKPLLEAIVTTSAQTQTATAIREAVSKEARAAVSTSIKHRLTKGAGKEVRQAAEEAALLATSKGAGQSGLLAKIEAQIADAVLKPATLAAEKALAGPLQKKLAQRMSEGARATLVEQLSAQGKDAVTTYKEKAAALAKPAGLEAATTFVGQTGEKITDAQKAEALAVINARVGLRVEKDATAVTERVVRSLPKASITAVVQQMIKTSLGGLVDGVTEQAAQVAAPPAAHQAAVRILRNHALPLAEAGIEQATAEAIDKANATMASSFATKVIEETASSMAEHYVGRAKQAAIKAALAEL